MTSRMSPRVLSYRRIAAAVGIAAVGALLLRGAVSTPAFGAAVILAALLGLVWLSVCLIVAGYVGVGMHRSPLQLALVPVLASATAFLMVRTGDMEAWLGWAPGREDWFFITSPSLGAVAAWIVHAPPSSRPVPRALERMGELPLGRQRLVGLALGSGLYVVGDWLVGAGGVSDAASILVPFVFPATLLVGVVAALLRLLTPKMATIAASALVAALLGNVVVFAVDNQPMSLAEDPEAILSMAAPMTFEMYGGVRPLSELGADELNRAHAEARAAGIRFVDANQPSTDLATVSVHPIDAHTWGAALYSPATQECHLVLLLADPSSPGLSETVFRSLNKQPQCVGLLATRGAMGR